MQASGIDVSAYIDTDHKSAAIFPPRRSDLPKSRRLNRTAKESNSSNDSCMIDHGWKSTIKVSSADSPGHHQDTASTTPSSQTTPRFPQNTESDWSNSYTATPEEMIRESIFAGRAAVEEVMRRLSMEQAAQDDSGTDSEVDEGISMPTKPHVNDIQIIVSAEAPYPDLAFQQPRTTRARGQSQGQESIYTAAADAVQRLDPGIRLKSEVDSRMLDELYDEELGTPLNTPAPVLGKGMQRANTVAATRGGKRLGRSVTAPLKSGGVVAECF